MEPLKNKTTYTISLEGLEFFAYHGASEAERSVGNRYQIDVWLDVLTDSVQNLSQTVDYVGVYEQIRTQMLVATPLLETIVDTLAEKLLLWDNRIQTVRLKVSKFNPPLGGICYCSAVEIERKRHES